MTELSNITFLMRSFKYKNIQNQQIYQTWPATVITVTLINKKDKKRGSEYLKTWVGIFQVEIFGGGFNRGEYDWCNFPGGSFHSTKSNISKEINNEDRNQKSVASHVIWKNHSFFRMRVLISFKFFFLLIKNQSSRGVL